MSSFTYYTTSLQIFHLYEFFSTNIFHVEKFLEIIKPFSEAATGGVPWRKPFSNILLYSQENNCAGVYFLRKLQAIRHVTLLKRDSNTDIILRISRILSEDLFWGTLANSCIVGKCFVITFFRSDLNLLCERLLKLA